MDFKKIIDINEIKKTLTRIENLAALGLVVFFFFPWASFGPASISGFTLGRFGAFNALVYFLYLIPILGLMIVAMRPICTNPQVLKIVKLVTGGLTTLSFVYALLTGGGEFLSAAGIGIYLTFIAGIIIILGTLDKVQLNGALPAVEGCQVEDTTQES